MPAQRPIHLSADETQQLNKNRRSRKTPIRLLERSSIILLAAAGIPNAQIATRLQIDVNKVGRWRNRFAARRLAGIEKDLPRGGNHGGKNSAEQAKLRSKIIALTTQSKPKDATHWSTRSLSDVLGSNHSWLNESRESLPEVKEHPFKEKVPVFLKPEWYAIALLALTSWIIFGLFW